MAALVAVVIVIIIIIAIIAFSRQKVVDLVARNLREPKGLAGYFVRVSWNRVQAYYSCINHQIIGFRYF